MTIEHRVEAQAFQPDYSGHEFTEDDIERGAHRTFVGGVWGTHGARQLDYLVDQGLQPQHRLVDVGCGAFRAGRHFIDHLEPGNYYGVDANHSLIQAGYDVELTDAQRERTPEAHLRANDRFDVDFGVRFDYAIAQSVFTHVSLNHIRLCLYRLGKSMELGGQFYATWFIRGDRTPLDHIGPSKSGKPFFTEKNVFWYYRKDTEWVADPKTWRVEWIGDWGHPAGQQMVRYVRRDRGPGPVRSRGGLVTRGRRWAARRIAP
jgi:SAM-dependent methyltransferase